LYLRKTLAYIVGLIFFFPIFFLLSSSVKPLRDILNVPPKLFGLNFKFSNFEVLFQSSYFVSSFVDSLIISIGSGLLTVIIAVYAGYCLSRFHFKLKSFFILFIISSRMLPLVAIAIPIYFVFSKLNLLDSIFSIILVHTFINLPLAVLLIKSFIDEIPKEIDDSAILDGASRMIIFHKLILPLSIGGIAVTFILSFIFSWTEFICSLVLGQMDVKTIPVQASIFKTAPSWDLMSALVVSSILPLFLLILTIQKYLVRGLTMGSIKE